MKSNRVVASVKLFTKVLGSAFIFIAINSNAIAHENRPTYRISKKEYEDKVKAVWTAQIISVVMGWQFEHKQASVLWVDRYTEQRLTEFVKNEGAPLDDDWYYEMAALKAFQKFGSSLTVEQLGKQWVENKVGTWGSSEMARLNLENGIKAPDSGHPRYNRLWFTMGNQCRGELFGLLAPGNPNLAAKLSSDLGHINSYAEGADGGIMVSAMISLAFVEKDHQAIIKKAIKILHPETPHRKCIENIIRLAEQGKTHREICKAIEDEWHIEYPATNNAVANMGLAVASLWFGEGEFLKTVNLAYAAADFTDADCNGAVAGSVVAAMHGTKALPLELIAPLRNRIKGTHLGPLEIFPQVDISLDELARTTVWIGEALTASSGAQVNKAYFIISHQEIRTREAEYFHPDEFVKYWNPEWEMERTGFGASGGGHRGIRGGTFLDGEVLATFPRDEVRGVVISRKLKLKNSETLSLEVAADPGRSWKLEILIDNSKVLSKVISGGPAIEWPEIAAEGFPPPTEEYIKSKSLRQWQLIKVDLSAFGDQEVTIRLYHQSLVRSAYPGNAYWRNLKIN